mmetsp:Transcript_10819/g.25926  ORF Transcript_10819/g.25926 Transcript_10819/m.25926 type:complete len:193 (+) Transcript_10819:23-601(+)
MASEELREITEGVWSLSTAKPGNEIEQLRDDNTDTFWQSDGPQPHLINIQYAKKTKVSEVHLYLSYKVDESYTPSAISVRIGTSFQDLAEVQVVDLKEPEGWVTVRLAAPRTTQAQNASCVPRDPTCGGAVDFVRTWLVQLAILSNHQNGRDTHVRQVKIFGPRVGGAMNTANREDQVQPQTLALLQYATVR